MELLEEVVQLAISVAGEEELRKHAAESLSQQFSTYSEAGLLDAKQHFLTRKQLIAQLGKLRSALEKDGWVVHAPPVKDHAINLDGERSTLYVSWRDGDAVRWSLVDLKFEAYEGGLKILGSHGCPRIISTLNAYNEEIKNAA